MNLQCTMYMVGTLYIPMYVYLPASLGRIEESVEADGGQAVLAEVYPPHTVPVDARFLQLVVVSPKTH